MNCYLFDHKVRLFLIFILLASFMLFVSGCSKKDKDVIVQEESLDIEEKGNELPTLTLGHVPSDNVVRLFQRLEPLTEYLGNELKMNIEPGSATDYSGIIERMKMGDFDIVMLGPLSYVEGHDKAGYEAILKPIRFGKPSYKSIIITRKNSGINKLEDLVGKTFAFTDEKSTSGYIYPKALLLKHKLIPGKNLRVFFAGEHDNVVLNVLRGEYDAGACYDDARVTALKNDKSKIDQLVIIAATDDIPNDPIAASPKLIKENPELVRKIKEAFIRLNTKTAGPQILKQLTGNIDGYIEASDSEYDVVREMNKFLETEKNPSK